MNPEIIACVQVLLSGLVAAFSPLFWRPILLKTGALDIPNHRSSHAKPTIRGAGIAQLTATIVLICLITLTSSFGETKLPILSVLIAATAIGVVGLVEDVYGLPAIIRAACQVLIGSGLTSFLWVQNSIGIGVFLFVSLFFVANVNFTNFMDGINGISGCFAMGVGFAYLLVGYISGVSVLVMLGAFTALVFGVFLFWNLTPPGMFLGDVGSYLLGALAGGMAIIALWHGVDPIAALSPLTIYWLDTVITLVKRLVLGQPIFEAHRMHIYQRITDRGVKHLHISVLVGVMTFVSGVSGLLAISSKPLWDFSSIFILFVICLLYINAPRFITAHRRVGR